MGGKRSEGNHEGFEDSPFITFQGCQFVRADHESGNGRVEREVLDIVFHLLDRFMQYFQFFFGRHLVAHAEIFAVLEQAPEFTQEFVHPVDTLRVPRFAEFQRSEEHLVQAQRVSPVFFDNRVGVHHVEHGLGHLLDSPATDVFPVFEDKLGIGEFRSPCTERIHV